MNAQATKQQRLFDPYECWEIGPGCLFFERGSAHQGRRDGKLLAPWADFLSLKIAVSELRKAEVKGEA